MSYIVKKNDTLTSIGKKLGIDWKLLASWNGLSAPYTLQIGQTLTTTPPKPVIPPVTPTDPSNGVRIGKRLIGSYVEDASGGTLWSLKPLTALETKLNYHFGLVSGFAGLGDMPDLVANMNAAQRQIVLSYEVEAKFADILSGKYDTKLKADAAALAKVGNIVYVRLWGEMNGDWSSWSVASKKNVTSTDQWIQAWKHVRALFTSANVKFVWCVNDSDAGSYKLEQYYPGDAWCDLVSFDGYNWNNPWQTHTQVFTSPYNRLVALAPNKAIMVGETSSAPGTKKAQWFTDLLNETGFPKITSVAFFSTNKETDWRLDSDATTLAAVKAALS